MIASYKLKPLQSSDFLVVREIYADAIESQANHFYSKDQIQAWSALAWLPGFLDKPLAEGKGWVSVNKNSVEAFALRYPSNRLALLYCRGRSSRRGHSSALLDCLELEARQEGQTSLVAEASLLSYPLLLKRGWAIEFPERIKIGGVLFDRYQMKKNLC